MEKKEFERLKNKALEKIGKKSVTFQENNVGQDYDQLIQINEIYQAELEAQNDELQTHILDLEEAQQELEVLFTQAPIPYILLTTKFKVLRANQQAMKLFGVNKIYSQTIPFYAYLYKKSMTEFLDWINKKDIDNSSIEMLLKTTKGLRFCKLHSHKWANLNNDTFLLSIEDIHLQKEESDKFKSLFNNSQQGIFFINNNNDIININETALEILGYDKDEIYMKNYYDLNLYFADEDKNTILIDDLPFFNSLSNKKRYSKEILSFVNKKTQKNMWISMDTIPHFGVKDEKIHGIFCIFTDISNAYILKQQLNEQLNNFQTLSNNMPDVILRIDENQNILFTNQEGVKLFNIETPSLVNKKVSELELFQNRRADDIALVLKNLSNVNSTLTHNLNNTSMNKHEHYFIRLIPENTQEKIKTFLLIIENITKRVETENMFNQLFFNASDAIILVDHDSGKVKSINSKAKKLLELETSQTKELQSSDIFELFQSPHLFNKHIEKLNNFGEDSYETTKLLNNGEILYLKIFCNIIEIGEKKYQQSIIHDLTEHKLLERQLKQSSKVFEHTVEGILITDLKGKIVSVNDAFSKITGYSRDEIISQKASILKSGKQNKEFYDKMWKDIKEKGIWKGEIWNKKKDGTIYPEWLAISPIYDEKNQPIQYVAVFSDFSEIKKNQIQLEELAHFDVLTNLPNRFSLHHHLDFIIKDSKRKKTRFALLFIDLDRFKNINDAYGHDIGDEVLRQVSKRLKSLLRDSDIVARIGGDEFVIVLNDIKTTKSVEKISQSILKQLENPFTISQIDHFISGSIGISLYPDDADDRISLLKYADIAMYKSKESGKNRYNLFSQDMANIAENISSLHNDLNKALNNNEFYVVYQPQYDILNDKVIGVEALIRWKHPTIGEISPLEFIEYAEESQLIIPIGKWVLTQAVRDYEEIKKVTKGKFTVAVNVSHVQLNQIFVNYLEYLINNDKNIVNVIKIEITETRAMKNLLVTQNILKQIKDLGFTISLDDFGTGYSALNVIKQLSIDEIKIDQSFIKDVPGDKDDEELVSSIIAMAKVMKKSLIAEGVETIETKKFLLERRCDNIQGYLISKPLILSDLLAFLNKS